MSTTQISTRARSRNEIASVLDAEQHASLRQEYALAVSLFRHHSRLRFVILALYLASVLGFGAIATGAFAAARSDPASVRAAAASALLFNVAFLMLEVFFERRLRYFRSVLDYLEECLRYTVMNMPPSARLVDPTLVLRSLYSLGVPLWLWLVLRGHL